MSKNLELRFVAPATHRLAVDDGDYVQGGETFLVPADRAEQLLADSQIDVEVVQADDVSPDAFTRAELDRVAEEAGLDPSSYRTKRDLLDALQTDRQTEADGGEGPNTDQPVEEN